MNAMMRTVLCAGIFIVSVQSIEWFAPNLLAEHLPPQSAATEPTVGSEGKEDGLEKERLAVLARVATRQHIIHELIQRRLTLQEAAARFSDLERRLPAALQLRFRLAFPARSDGEHFCREVLSHAALEVHGQPLRAQQLLDYLRPQWQQASSNWSPAVSFPALVTEPWIP
jgi:hypothetical protein